MVFVIAHNVLAKVRKNGQVGWFLYFRLCCVPCYFIFYKFGFQSTSYLSQVNLAVEGREWGCPAVCFSKFNCCAGIFKSSFQSARVSTSNNRNSILDTQFVKSSSLNWAAVNVKSNGYQTTINPNFYNYFSRVVAWHTTFRL